MNLIDRFEQKIERIPIAGCWLWTASLNEFGYGWFGTTDKNVAKAHRVAWEIYKGPIPNYLLVLHRCDVPSCVNPDHLFLGTDADNIHDMIQKGRSKSGAYNKIKTHCSKGHEFTQDNTYRKSRPSGGRRCAQCEIDGAMRRYWKRKHAASSD